MVVYKLGLWLFLRKMYEAEKAGWRANLNFSLSLNFHEYFNGS